MFFVLQVAEGNYAFMNSEAALKYMYEQMILYNFLSAVYRYLISAQYTNQYRESNLHVAKECYVSFKIGLAMPKYSPYKERVNQIIDLVVAGGFIQRWLNEMNGKAERENRQVCFTLFSKFLYQ